MGQYVINGDVVDLEEATTGFDVGSGIAVASGVVYVGSGDGNVYALRASDDARLWDFAAGNAVYSGIAVSGRTVYAGSYDHRVYALRAQTAGGTR